MVEVREESDLVGVSKSVFSKTKGQSTVTTKIPRVELVEDTRVELVRSSSIWSGFFISFVFYGTK